MRRYAGRVNEPSDKPMPPASGPHLQPLSPRGRVLAWCLGALAVAWLLFGAWGVWKTLRAAPASGASDAAQLATQRQRLGELEQQVATLTRSDQISRAANADLQGTLSERDEEIAGLRADVAFYERFVGATAQRRGLNVHELKLQAQGEQAWHFTATLVQNLNRGAVNAGRVRLAVEGTQGGKLKRLAWADLRQQADAPGVAYSFKYFQRVEGDFVLPAGFVPLRVTARLEPQGAATVEQSFAWADAIAEAGAGGA